MSHIKITSADGKYWNTKIELNGKPLDSVSDVEFGVDRAQGAWVKLTLFPESVEIDGDVLVYASMSLPFGDRDR